MTGSLAGKTLFITGASRGMGSHRPSSRADGANVAIRREKRGAASEGPAPFSRRRRRSRRRAEAPYRSLATSLRGTGRARGGGDGQAICGIDILVNNASPIDLRGIESLEMKRYDLMQQINGRGAYLCAKLALPHLKKAANPAYSHAVAAARHDPKWFSPNLAYTIAKYGMSW